MFAIPKRSVMRRACWRSVRAGTPALSGGTRKIRTIAGCRAFLQRNITATLREKRVRSYVGWLCECDEYASQPAAKRYRRLVAGLARAIELILRMQKRAFRHGSGSEPNRTAGAGTDCPMPAEQKHPTSIMGFKGSALRAMRSAYAIVGHLPTIGLGDVSAVRTQAINYCQGSQWLCCSVKKRVTYAAWPSANTTLPLPPKSVW